MPDMGAGGFVAFVALALWPWLAFQEGYCAAAAGGSGQCWLGQESGISQ